LIIKCSSSRGQGSNASFISSERGPPMGRIVRFGEVGGSRELVSRQTRNDSPAGLVSISAVIYEPGVESHTGTMFACFGLKTYESIALERAQDNHWSHSGSHTIGAVTGG
jgi:hypothetical protein